jgi:hypothetical protein
MNIRHVPKNLWWNLYMFKVSLFIQLDKIGFSVPSPCNSQTSTPVDYY